MKIEIIDSTYTRKSVEDDTDSMYIFTDNNSRTSKPNALTDNVDKNVWYYKKYKKNKPIHYGSLYNPTSAVIRGLNNAYPISTMIDYGVNWVDSNLELFKEVISDEVEQIKKDITKFKKLKIGNFRIGQGGKFARLPKQHQDFLDEKLFELGIDNTNNKPKIMTEIDFDSWDDYTPVGDIDLKKIIPKEVNNPNLIKLLLGDDFETFGIEKVEFEDSFEHNSEEDYHENVFVRFIKYEESNGVTVFCCPKDEDLFLITKNDKKYVLYNYQNSSFYFDDNKLTFAGWDDNIIIDTKKMTMKKKSIR